MKNIIHNLILAASNIFCIPVILKVENKLLNILYVGMFMASTLMHLS